MEKTEQVLRMKFDGQLHQVDSNTFVTSLIGLSEIIKQVNSEMNPGAIVDIKINALEKGSFIAVISTAISATANLLPTIVSNASNTITVVQGIYNLRKFLKGDKPKETRVLENGKIEIKDNNGNLTIVNSTTYNIYTSNPTIHKAITGQFSALQEDPSVQSFELSTEDNDKESFIVDKMDFRDLSIVKNNILDQDKKIEQIIAELTMNKLIFETNQTRKWEFYYNGNKISANIIDNDFFKRIDSGEAFAKGDRLRVELNVCKMLDKTVNVYVIESYTVTKILEHIKRPENPSLFDSPSKE